MQARFLPPTSETFSNKEKVFSGKCFHAFQLPPPARRLPLRISSQNSRWQQKAWLVLGLKPWVPTGAAALSGEPEEPVGGKSEQYTMADSSLLFFSFVVGVLWAVATVPVAKAQDGFDFGPERQTHLHFFFHDVLSGPNPTAITIVRPPNVSTTGFGTVSMIDDALTEGPDPSSKLLGRAQGMYAVASQEDVALLMALNFHFVEGNYSGSTLAVLGRNSVLSPTREMAVVGGTGFFRLARGYAVAKTQRLDGSTGDAVVEYDVYVVHQGPQGSGTGTGSGSRTSDSPSPSTASARSVLYFPLLLLVQALSFLSVFMNVCI